VDHNKLNLAATKEELLDVLRIVITTINVMTAKPLVFDNTMMHTEAKQILPSIVYPIYCFPWIEIEDGMLAWDGSLLSNTLIREVLYVSLKNDKNIFIIKLSWEDHTTAF
jgi:NTE family protein